MGNKLSTYEKIELNYQDPERYQLTELEQRRKEAYKTVYGLLMKAKSMDAIVKKTMHLCDCSQTTAYQYIKEVKRIYADLNKTDKEFERHFLLETLKKGLRLAFKEQNLRGIASLSKSYAVVAQLNEVEIELPDFENIQPPTIILGNFSEELGVPQLPKSELEQQLVALIRKKKTPIQDAEIIEIDEN